MRAVVLHGTGDVRCSTVPDPTLESPSDAIVSVTATAICGADLFPYHGLTPGFEDGTILGHEFVGVVEEVGADTRQVRPGQRVVNTSTISDGTCAHCRAGRPSQCLNRALFGYSGIYERLEGGQAELVRIPNADRVLRELPTSVPDEAGIFLSDILPTGYGAVRRGGVEVGDVVFAPGLSRHSAPMRSRKSPSWLMLYDPYRRREPFAHFTIDFWAHLNQTGSAEWSAQRRLQGFVVDVCATAVMER